MTAYLYFLSFFLLSYHFGYCKKNKKVVLYVYHIALSKACDLAARRANSGLFFTLQL